MNTREQELKEHFDKLNNLPPEPERDKIDLEIENNVLKNTLRCFIKLIFDNLQIPYETNERKQAKIILDEIKKLKEQNIKYLAALKPFAEHLGCDDEGCIAGSGEVLIKQSDICRTAEVLEEETK